MSNCFLPRRPVRRGDSPNNEMKVAKETKYSKQEGFTSALGRLATKYTLFSCFSNKSSSKHDIPMTCLLTKLANTYEHNHHNSSSSSSSISTTSASLTASKGFNSKAEEGGVVKRIKVVITKQQLQELLSKQIQLQDLLSSLPPVQWKPALHSIPEGYEL